MDGALERRVQRPARMEESHLHISAATRFDQPVRAMRQMPAERMESKPVDAMENRIEPTISARIVLGLVDAAKHAGAPGGPLLSAVRPAVAQLTLRKAVCPSRRCIACAS